MRNLIPHIFFFLPPAEFEIACYKISSTVQQVVKWLWRKYSITVKLYSYEALIFAVVALHCLVYFWRLCLLEAWSVKPGQSHQGIQRTIISGWGGGGGVGGGGTVGEMD